MVDVWGSKVIGQLLVVCIESGVVGKVRTEGWAGLGAGRVEIGNVCQDSSVGSKYSRVTGSFYAVEALERLGWTGC